MIDPSTTPVATAAALTVTLTDCLLSLHRQGRLRVVALQALADKALADAARAAGLQIAVPELQEAANRFRQHGLSSAEATTRWLDQNCWSIDDFEAALERDLLIAKFRHHLTEPRLADHFATHRDRYTRARLRQIVVASEGQARELLSRLMDEGADFADLARQHSLDALSRQTGGAAGLVPRHGLPPAVADAVFSASPPSVLGPFFTPEGVTLLLVEELLPAQLDEETAEAIRQELLDAWLAEQLRDVHIDLSWLEAP